MSRTTNKCRPLPTHTHNARRPGLIPGLTDRASAQLASGCPNTTAGSSTRVTVPLRDSGPRRADRLCWMHRNDLGASGEHVAGPGRGPNISQPKSRSTALPGSSAATRVSRSPIFTPLRTMTSPKRLARGRRSRSHDHLHLASKPSRKLPRAQQPTKAPGSRIVHRRRDHRCPSKERACAIATTEPTRDPFRLVGLDRTLSREQLTSWRCTPTSCESAPGETLASAGKVARQFLAVIDGDIEIDDRSGESRPRPGHAHRRRRTSQRPRSHGDGHHADRLHADRRLRPGIQGGCPSDPAAPARSPSCVATAPAGRQTLLGRRHPARRQLTTPTERTDTMITRISYHSRDYALLGFQWVVVVVIGRLAP